MVCALSNKAIEKTHIKITLRFLLPYLGLYKVLRRMESGTELKRMSKRVEYVLRACR
jgi:hypothetical protein